MRPRHKILAVALVIVLLASCTASYFIGKASFTGSLENLPWYAGAPIEHSYIVTTNTTNFFCFNGTTGRLELTTTNSSAAIMNALNNVTIEGGSVFVKSGVYSATVVLKNNTRLVLDKGAAGVTVSIDTGATCIFEDYNAGISWWYSAGLLVMQHNNLNGLITGTFSSFTQYYSSGLNRTDAVVNPIAPATFIVDKTGTTYRAKNGTTGQIDYSSTNATYIINTVLYNTSINGGGTVLLRSGSYYASDYEAGFVIYNNTRLLGENKDSVFLINDRGAGTGKLPGLIRNEHHTNASYGTAPSTWARDANFTIESLTLVGQRGSGKFGFGISIFNSDNITLRDITLSSFAADTINFNGLAPQQGGMGQGNGTCQNVKMTSIEINNAGIDGIAMNEVQGFILDVYYCNGFSQIGSGTNNGHALTITESHEGTISNVIAANSTKVTATGAHGICLFGGYSLSFSNIWLYNCDGDGFHAETSTYDPDYIQITNMHCINSTFNGVRIVNGQYATISNVECRNSGYGNSSSLYYNFDIYNVDDSIFSNIICIDDQATHSTWLGFASPDGSGSNYNIVSNISIFGARNATGYVIQGANSVTGDIINLP